MAVIFGSAGRSCTAVAIHAAITSTPPSATAPCMFAQSRNSTGSHQRNRRRTSSESVSAHIVNVTTCGRRHHAGLDSTAPNPIRPTRTIIGPGVSRDTIYTALEDNELETFYANFVAGLKFQTAENQALSGAVSVPLNADEGFRPDAIGTIAYEFFF